MLTRDVRIYYDFEKKKSLLEEYFKLNGKIHGPYKTYFRNGVLWSEINFINDKNMVSQNHIIIMVIYAVNVVIWMDCYMDGLLYGWIVTWNI
jgi:antitoxin component YwqK of YwqJK toxin-antitoxin module